MSLISGSLQTGQDIVVCAEVPQSHKYADAHSNSTTTTNNNDNDNSNSNNDNNIITD